jgi:hypothetical protein
LSEILKEGQRQTLEILKEGQRQTLESQRETAIGIDRLGDAFTRLVEVLDKDGYDQISESSNPKKLGKDDYTAAYGVPVPDLQCMVTGVSQNSITPPGGPQPKNPVTLAHLLPRCASGRERASLGYDLSDIESIRNSILLCKGIEQAFDQKHISFVPMDHPFQPDRYKLQIWFEGAKKKPIYEGAIQTIEDYDGHPLILQVGTQTHNPFNRTLSYQAFRAFKSHGKDNGFEFPVNSDISVYQGWYNVEREKYKKQLMKDIQRDAEEAEESD